MLGGMTRRVQHIDPDIPERKPVSVLRGMEGKRNVRAGVQHILGSRRVGERPPGRTMVGVNMGIDDEADAHRGLVRDPEVWFDIA